MEIESIRIKRFNLEKEKTLAIRMECVMQSFYSAGGVVTFLRISVPWISW